MNDDPTIARIRQVRHQISEQYHHNSHEMITHYIEREQQHEGRFIDLTEGTNTLREARDGTCGKKIERPVNIAY